MEELSPYFLDTTFKNGMETRLELTLFLFSGCKIHIVFMEISHCDKICLLIVQYLYQNVMHDEI
jgi:hypothetical protein